LGTFLDRATSVRVMLEVEIERIAQDIQRFIRLNPLYVARSSRPVHRGWLQPCDCSTSDEWPVSHRGERTFGVRGMDAWVRSVYRSRQNAPSGADEPSLV